MCVTSALASATLIFSHTLQPLSSSQVLFNSHCKTQREVWYFETAPFELYCEEKGLLLPPSSICCGTFILQAIKTPKVTFRYFQDLLGKHFDNPQVARYQSWFPEHQLEKDARRETVIFRLSE